MDIKVGDLVKIRKEYYPDYSLRIIKYFEETDGVVKIVRIDYGEQFVFKYNEKGQECYALENEIEYIVREKRTGTLIEKGVIV